MACKHLVVVAVGLALCADRAAAQPGAGPGDRHDDPPAEPAADAESTPEPEFDDTLARPPRPHPELIIPATDEFRGLPRCPREFAYPEFGTPWTCRPPYPEPVFSTSFGVSLAPGLFEASAPTTHAGYLLGIWMDWWTTRSLALGWRLDLLAIGRPVPETSPDEPNTRASGVLAATARYRLFTDEVEREAWTLSAGGGLLWGGLPGAGVAEPIGLVTVGREIGTFIGTSSAFGVSLELGYLHGFGPSELRGIVGSVRHVTELGIRKPRNLDTEASPPDSRFTFTPVVLGGSVGGYGFAWGLQLTDSLAVKARADVSKPFGGGTLYGALAGLQYRFSWPAQAPSYVEVGAGYGLFTGQPEAQPGPIVDLETGLNLISDCNAVLDLGVRARGETTRDGVRVRAVFLDIEFQFGRDYARPRSQGLGCLPPSPPYAERYVPVSPPAVEAKIPAPPETPRVREAEVEVRPPRVEADVEVEVEPITVEVVLGYELLGGALRIEVDPGVLPLSRLARAGWATVEIRGPASSLAQAEVQLTAALRRGRVNVSAISRVRTQEREIRAIFTIWPPGTRPPAADVP